MKLITTVKNGLFQENPVFRLVLGMCPALATTGSVENAIGMGFATTFVLIISNTLISLLKGFIPPNVRIPAYIVIIATPVTALQMLLEAYLPAVNSALGIFIPLITVNCILLARAETFASKNSFLSSALDGLGIGAGFLLALVLVAALRELLGAGTLLGYPVLGEGYEPVMIMVIAPGGFFALGLIMAAINKLSAATAPRKKGGRRA